MRKFSLLAYIALLVILTACATPSELLPTASQLQETDAPIRIGSIPSTVQQSLNLPRPKINEKIETYSVVVNNVPVHELLFALARDAKVNIDIHAGILGNVTLNAINQTLPQILTRLAKQLDLRWELNGPNLAVMPDTPYLQSYKIDYVNMKRDASGSVQVSGEIASAAISSAGGSTGGNNGSTAKIENSSKNNFWDTLISNIKDMLRETDKILPEGSSDTTVEQDSSQQTSGLLNHQTPPPNARHTASPIPSSQTSSGTTIVKRATFREAASVMAHPESGIISVRATARQHEKIQEFLDQVMSSAKRQVLIEATIAEVELTKQYEQGVDWGHFASNANSNGFFFSQTSAAVSGPGLLTLASRSNNGSASYFSSAISLLETFGTVKVLSSPKISAINNQSAILKVVDNQVYFTVKSNTVTSSSGSDKTVTTEQKVVPVGFIMNVTPQISGSDEVLLNVRPSITRIQKFVSDPNPSLGTVPNLVPIIRTREMETVIRVQDGNIAVMGGLMEEQLQNVDSAVPWFHSIPLIGPLFTQKSSTTRKTELVIFLRPTIIRESSINGDFDRIREHLPRKDFFSNNPGPRYQLLPSVKEETKK